MGVSCELTNGLEGHVGERCTEVVVEEAFEDVHCDVGQAGVNVGVDGQNHSVSSDHAARGDVSLMMNQTHTLLLFFLERGIYLAVKDQC